MMNKSDDRNVILKMTKKKCEGDTNEDCDSNR